MLVWLLDGYYIVVCIYVYYLGLMYYLCYMSFWMFYEDGGKGVEVVKGGKGEMYIILGVFFSFYGKFIYFLSYVW